MTSRRGSYSHEDQYLFLVVLSGGYLTVGRVKAAIHFINNLNRKAILIISSLDENDIIRIIAQGIKRRENLVTIIAENRSGSTIDNVYYIKKIAMSMDMKHVILVTSAFHMKRAYTLLKRALGNVIIIPYPVPDKPTYYLQFKEFLARIFVFFALLLINDDINALRRIQRIKLLLMPIEKTMSIRVVQQIIN